MPIYDYKCSKCDNSQEELRPFEDKTAVLCEECSSPCDREVVSRFFGIDKNREAWDYNDVRKVKPKWLKSTDGKTRVRYDSSKHGYGKGTG